MTEEPTPPVDVRDPAVLVQSGRIALLAEVATIALYLYLYRQTGAWQMVAAAGLAAVALLGSVLSLGLARRRPGASRVVLLVTFVLAYSSGEWLFSDLTVPLLATGALAVLTLGNLLFPRRFWVWLGTGVLFAGNVWAAPTFAGWY